MKKTSSYLAPVLERLFIGSPRRVRKMNTKSSYLIIALERLLKGEKLSSIPHAKNSNQYFSTIKNHGIELVEVWKPNLTNQGRHKERSLHRSVENIERAKKYLESLRGIRSKQS